MRKMLLLALMLIPGVAYADFTPPTVSTSEYLATAGVILTAIGAIWGLRKVIKLMNRS